MQMKAGVLTLKYRIISGYMREKKPLIWVKEFGIVLYLKCKNKSLFYCRVLSSDVLVVVVRPLQVMADCSGIREVLCSYHRIKE